MDFEQIKEAKTDDPRQTQPNSVAITNRFVSIQKLFYSYCRNTVHLVRASSSRCCTDLSNPKTFFRCELIRPANIEFRMESL